MTDLGELLLDVIVDLVDASSLLALHETLLGDLQRSARVRQRLLQNTLVLLQARNPTQPSTAKRSEVSYLVQIHVHVLHGRHQGTFYREGTILSHTKSFFSNEDANEKEKFRCFTVCTQHHHFKSLCWM